MCIRMNKEVYCRTSIYYLLHALTLETLSHYDEEDATM